MICKGQQSKVSAVQSNDNNLYYMLLFWYPFGNGSMVTYFSLTEERKPRTEKRTASLASVDKGTRFVTVIKIYLFLCLGNLKCLLERQNWLIGIQRKCIDLQTYNNYSTLFLDHIKPGGLCDVSELIHG